LALEGACALPIGSCNLAQSSIGYECFAKCNSCCVAAAAHRRAYDGRLDAVLRKCFADLPSVRFALDGQHRFTLATSAFVPSKRIAACGLGMTHQHNKISFGLELLPQQVIRRHLLGKQVE